jgi:hypothetical protein
MAFGYDMNVDMILIYIHFSYIIFTGYKREGIYSLETMYRVVLMH